DEATLPTGNIDYYLNKQEMLDKLSQLASCGRQGAGSKACQQMNQSNWLDHTRNVELQAACQDMSSPGCLTQISKAQAALESYEDKASPWDDTRLGDMQGRIQVTLDDPSGRERQAQEEQFYDVFNGIVDLTIAGDVKAFYEAESELDYVLATVGVIPGGEIAGSLIRKAVSSLKAGRVDEAQKLLVKAQEHLKHADADFDDLPSSNQLALTEKASSHPPELPHSGKQDGDAVTPHEKPSTPEAESTLAKNDAQGSDIGGDDGRMQGEDVAPKGTLSKAEATSAGLPELPNGYHYRTVGSETQVVRNSGQAGKLPPMHLENGKLIPGSKPSVVRNTATRSAFLKDLANSDKVPSNIKPWLEQGKVPPGYTVHHKKALFDGGTDSVDNMVLQGVDLHKNTHKFYRPGGKVPSINPSQTNPY
ncbi:HNH endonuclease signature motif containing protein, partial [Photobacterium sp. 53610]|uniref:HNH endonuclease signature motif containing protein n=1 Tax=Photobacterium sp. 53610 TaxID=3102789 RepID=UPI002ED86DFD